MPRNKFNIYNFSWTEIDYYNICNLKENDPLAYFLHSMGNRANAYKRSQLWNNS